jgi:hypothetical protein
LKKLSTGSEAYDHACEKAMERIEGQIADSQELAKQVLSWITCAKRPLTKSELRHALAVEPSASELDEENLPEIEDIVSVCAGLVTVDEESNIVRLAHYTTQEYFERTQRSWFPDAEIDIGKTCVTYLSFNTFNSGFCQTGQEFEQRLRSYQLYDYAARNWGYHARKAMTLSQSITDFLESEVKVSASTQAMLASKRDLWPPSYSEEVPRRMTAIHLAAYFGLDEVVNAMIKRGHKPGLKDTHGRTPLSWAAENGHEAVVQLLLADDRVDLDAKDKQNRTPLWKSVKNGHEAIARLLLATARVDPNAKDDTDRTPLWRAAANGHEAVVELLLATERVNPNSKDRYGQTPLLQAAGNGREAVVKLLLNNDKVDTGFIKKFRNTPLSRAMKTGNSGVIKLLLEHYDKNGIIVCDEGVSTEASLVVDIKGHIVCDICDSIIPDVKVHYHCDICRSGDFDICQDCRVRGALCLNNSHELIKRTVNHDKVVVVLD